MEHYVYKDNKKLRCGYTTGTCAAAATKGAMLVLMGASEIDNVLIMTPKGIELKLDIKDVLSGGDWVSCGVQKDSGDDPDITNGVMVYAKIKKSEEVGIRIDGGIGVGRVTKKGLECDVGMAAINKVPRMMIEKEVKAICDECDYHGGIDVEIYIPKGEELAKKTYNPRLGIVGGISVLGTSGIVEPMSEQALVDSIKVEMDILRANGFEYIIVTPGNYGEVYAEQSINVDMKNSIKCSNFAGEVLDYAVGLEFKGVLMVGHIGKFVKLAGGIMNTHSRYADCRMEIIATHSALVGANIKTLQNIMNSITTDQAIEELDKVGLRELTLDKINEKIDFHINARVYEQIKIGAIVFSNKYGFLFKTKGTDDLLKCLKEQEVNK